MLPDGTFNGVEVIYVALVLALSVVVAYAQHRANAEREVEIARNRQRIKDLGRALALIPSPGSPHRPRWEAQQRWPWRIEEDLPISAEDKDRARAMRWAGRAAVGADDMTRARIIRDAARRE